MGVFFEHLLEEHLTGDGQLVDQPANPPGCREVDDGALGLKDLAHSMAIWASLDAAQVPDVVGDRADANHDFLLQLRIHAVLDLLGDLDQILALVPLRYLFDQNHIVFVERDDIVILPVRNRA